ncbi:hypothetical protein Rs2_18309 [Raphanus sativus]|nr:hypothetical protein Rs2_18309 [Raphanus sativus]
MDGSDGPACPALLPMLHLPRGGRSAFNFGAVPFSSVVAGYRTLGSARAYQVFVLVLWLGLDEISSIINEALENSDIRVIVTEISLTSNIVVGGSFGGRGQFPDDSDGKALSLIGCYR